MLKKAQHGHHRPNQSQRTLKTGRLMLENSKNLEIMFVEEKQEKCEVMLKCHMKRSKTNCIEYF